MSELQPIWVHEPKIPDKAVEYVSDAVRSSWISGSGHYVQEFEKKFAEYTGIKYATVCSNGTTALQLALAAMEVRNGDEVVIPDQTIISCALAPLYLGASPVVVDVERDTFCIDVSKIEEKITPKTKVIMPVHLYGQCCDMDRILAIAKKHHLYVLEDAAEAIGAEYKGEKAGSIGDIGSFSLFANKLITSGEGGVLTTNSVELYEKMVNLKDLAHSKEKRFWHEEMGFNFRMTNYQCALALASLEEVEISLAHKQSMAEWYNSGLDGIKGLTIPITADYNNINSFWMYTVLVENDFGMSRDEFVSKLWKDYKVQVRTFFYPIHSQPVFKKRGLFKSEKCPVSENLSKKGLYLPSGLTLTKNQAERVIYAIKAMKGGS